MTPTPEPVIVAIDVGGRATCTMSASPATPGEPSVAWNPRRPKRLSAAECDDLRRGREELARRLADARDAIASTLDPRGVANG
jgi:hypothetical protein